MLLKLDVEIDALGGREQLKGCIREVAIELRKNYRMNRLVFRDDTNGIYLYARNNEPGRLYYFDEIDGGLKPILPPNERAK